MDGGRECEQQPADDLGCRIADQQRTYNAKKHHKGKRIGHKNRMVEHLELTSPKKQQPDKRHRYGNKRPAIFIGIRLHFIDQQLRVFCRLFCCRIQISRAWKIKVCKTEIFERILILNNVIGCSVYKSCSKLSCFEFLLYLLRWRAGLTGSCEIRLQLRDLGLNFAPFRTYALGNALVLPSALSCLDGDVCVRAIFRNQPIECCKCQENRK